MSPTRSHARIVLGLLAALWATPASACQAVPRLEDIDRAIVGARLSPAEADQVLRLRAEVADQLRRGDYRGATAAEAKAMAIMRLRFEDDGRVVRGGCNGRWVAAR